MAVDGGQSVSSVLLLLPSGAFHAAVCTQRQDGEGEELTAATRGSWRPCRGGVCLELPEEDGGAGAADELEYERRSGHLVACTGALPEGLAQEYAPGQPDGAIVQLVAQKLFIDSRSAFGAAPPAIVDAGAQATVAAEDEEEELLSRPPLVIADGDDGDSDCSTLSDVIDEELGCAGAAAAPASEGASARNAEGGSPAEEDYAEDFEQPSDEEEEDGSEGEN